MGEARATPAALGIETAPRPQRSQEGPGRLGESDFVGRQVELAALSEELAHARLVTVTGPGGVGKSRLARQTARRVSERLARRVVLVDLEGLGEPALALEALAGAVLGQHAATDLHSAVVRALSEGETLLLLDGCERLVAGVKGLVEALLRACPGLRVLATSQRVLGLASEHVFRLGPLAVPEAGELGRESLLAYGAVELFAAQARAACPGLAIDDSGAAAIARICRHVDGLPLALELVAPSAKRLSLEQLADAVEEGVAPAGSGGRPAGPARHRSLETALEWSFGLLSERERRLLEVLSVFVGGADLAALASLPARVGVRPGLVECLAGLVEKSVVSMSVAHGVARYDLLGVVRRHVQAGLERKGRLEGLARLQLAWCSELVAGAEEALISGPHQARFLELVAGEQANLRAALGFALEAGDEKAAGALACQLWRFWELRGQLSEGRHWLERVLAQGSLPAGLRAHLLDGLGMLAWRQGDHLVATAALEEALVLARSSGEAREAARLGNHLGLVALFAGEVALAGRRFEHSRAELERLGSPGEVAAISANLALVAIEEGRLEEACQLLGAAVAAQVALGDRHGRATSLLHRAIARYYLEDHHCGRDDACEAAAVFLELGDERSLAFCLLVLSATLAGQLPVVALELAGLAAALEERVGIRLPVGWDARVELALAPAREALGAKADEIERRGAALEPAVAVARASAGQLGEPAGPEKEPWASVETLGRFEVRRRGQRVHLAPQVALLLKLVVAEGGLLHVEQAVEELWPGVESERGRRRLRNVLARLHRSAGPIVVRAGQELVLAGGVGLDSERFEAAARQAVLALTAGEDGPAARRQARAAARLYGGEFLPEERYELWAASARERLRRFRLRLLDAWAAAARAEGVEAEAEACLRVGIESDPTDEGRYLSLAGLLAGAGRLAAAAAVLSRARAMAEELGLPFSPAVAALESTLTKSSAGS